MMQPTFYSVDQVDENEIRYAVIAARFQGRWIFCRHRDRSTWELPGGHRELNETPMEAARRELYEETGTVDAHISVIGCYKLNDYGLLCFAEVEKLASIPENSEIAQFRLMDKCPDNLTYGAHSQLFYWVQGWLNMQTNANELWDVLDADGKPTGRIHRRGDFLNPGDYHLVVDIWMRNSRGEYLLTKRSPNKGFPNMWETTGGSALAGDDSLTAALREVREETGLKLLPENGKLALTCMCEDCFRDVWVFHQDFDLKDVVLQDGETCDVMYASKDAILRMYREGTLVPFRYLEEFFSMI